jgi:hypothetical protein
MLPPSSGLYYSGCQSQQSFLLFSHSTHSLHVLARACHLQVNIIILTDPLFWLSLQILSVIIKQILLSSLGMYLKIVIYKMLSYHNLIF